MNQEGGRDYLSQPTGYLFSKFTLFVLLAFLLLAAWFSQIAIVVLLGLILSTAGVSLLWSRLSLTRVDCRRTISEPRVFPGEEIELTLRLVNRKLLPLPWVQLDDQIPEPIAPPDVSLEPADRPGCRILTQTASLPWYSGLTWRSRLLCRKRGYYKLGPLTVRSGDIFGLYPRSAVHYITDHVIVYPKLYPIARMEIPSLYPMGETQAERRIFEDPTRTIGVRDYSPADSLRHVHWKASARHQQLKVKIFEPTTTLTLAIFLAVDTFRDDAGAGRDDDFELGVSAAASVANYVIQQRSPAGIFANTRLVDSSEPVRVLPGSGLRQLANILEALARVNVVPSMPFSEFLRDNWGALPWGTTIILVISRPPHDLPPLLARIKAGGYKTLVIQIGDGEKAYAEQASAWYTIKSPEDLNELRGNR
ncbi:MAG: DUF58 domain-containing protein [Dehalococcoidales bacterium]|nr:DUF58 domain-containing protein [Dehalococcoidales bacterium]